MRENDYPYRLVLHLSFYVRHLYYDNDKGLIKDNLINMEMFP